MNKSGKVKELTLGGSILLIIVGIIALAMSSADPTGLIFGIGLVFILVGIVGIVLIVIGYFKQ